MGLSIRLVPKDFDAEEYKGSEEEEDELGRGKLHCRYSSFNDLRFGLETPDKNCHEAIKRGYHFLRGHSDCEGEWSSGECAYIFIYLSYAFVHSTLCRCTRNEFWDFIKIVEKCMLKPRTKLIFG